MTVVGLKIYSECLKQSTKEKSTSEGKTSFEVVAVVMHSSSFGSFVVLSEITNCALRKKISPKYNFSLFRLY